MQDLFALYLFDTNLRDITLSTIQTIEYHLRSIVAYRIAGSDQKDYFFHTNYNLGNLYTDGYQLDKLFKFFDYIIADDIKHFKHYRESYNNCPLWISLKGSILGNLIFFIKLQKTQIK